MVLFCEPKKGFPGNNKHSIAINSSPIHYLTHVVFSAVTATAVIARGCLPLGLVKGPIKTDGPVNRALGIMEAQL